MTSIASKPASERNVKSAQRVLEVLEHFAETREPATVAEVSAHLGYPQSSTSMLLASLVSLGYLSYDAGTRRFRPTLRVLLLGAWMQEELLGYGALPFAMDRLRNRNNLAVMIGIRQDLQVRYVLLLRRTLRNVPGHSDETLKPVCISAIGKILLSDEKDDMVRRIAIRANAAAEEPAHRVKIAPFVEEIRAVRERGWAECPDFPERGVAGLAIRLPGFEGHPRMGLGVGVTMARLATHRDQIIETLRQEARMLAPQGMDVDA